MEYLDKPSNTGLILKAARVPSLHWTVHKDEWMIVVLELWWAQQKTSLWGSILMPSILEVTEVNSKQSSIKVFTE